MEYSYLFSVVILSLQSSSYFIREASGTLSLEMCIVIQKGSLERDVSITMVVTNGTGEKLISMTLKCLNLETQRALTSHAHVHAHFSSNLLSVHGTLHCVERDQLITNRIWGIEGGDNIFRY